MEEPWDCVVVGGGAAGLSAALVLGRARRRTLLIDAGRPSNSVAHGIGGLLGQDGRPPAEYYEAGRAELRKYPAVEIGTGEIRSGATDDPGFTLELDDGSVESARRVLLATGMDYEYTDLPGAEQRWGRSVFHCPFCHGWEVQGRPLGVLDPDPKSGVHRALLLRAWSDEVTLLTNGPAQFEADQADRLRAAGVAIDERPVARLDGAGSELESVVFEDGSELSCGGLLTAVHTRQRSGLARELGAEATDPGGVAIDALEVDSVFRTTVKGLYAAGDLTSQMPSVAAAVAAGSVVAAAIVGDQMLD